MNPPTPDFFAGTEEDEIYEMLQAKYASQLQPAAKPTFNSKSAHHLPDPFEGVFDSDSDLSPTPSKTNLAAFFESPQNSPSAVRTVSAPATPLVQMPTFGGQDLESLLLPLLRSYSTPESNLSQCCSAVSAVAVAQIQKYTSALHEAHAIPGSAAQAGQTSGRSAKDLFFEPSPVESATQMNIRRINEAERREQQQLARQKAELEEQRQQLKTQAARLTDQETELTERRQQLQKQADQLSARDLSTQHSSAAVGAEHESFVKETAKEAARVEQRHQMALKQLSDRCELSTREVSELRGALLKARQACQTETTLKEEASNLREEAVNELIQSEGKVQDISSEMSMLSDRLEAALVETVEVATLRDEVSATRFELQTLKAAEDGPGALIGKFEQLLARVESGEGQVEKLQQENALLVKKQDELQVKLHACKQLIRRYAID